MKESATILTLDAGGTNFVFSAMKNRELIVDPIRLPAHAHDQNQCLSALKEGFHQIIRSIDPHPEAISFAFPGPADYRLGVLGDLPNFPAFNGGVPLGPILENEFQIPVFINNDGNLFALGEATSGCLPEINKKLKQANSPKQIRNLIGLTLGTGIGSGFVSEGKLFLGDHSGGAEIHNALNPTHPEWNCEESVSTRAIQRVYAEASNQMFNPELLPGEIYAIARGTQAGNQAAALQAFREFGQALGATICNVVTLFDGLVVLGGGIAKGWDLFGADVMVEIQKKYVDLTGVSHERLSYQMYDLTREDHFQEFAKGDPQVVSVPGSNKTLIYDATPRTGLTVTKLGTSRSIMLGAYDFAIANLTPS